MPNHPDPSETLTDELIVEQSQVREPPEVPELLGDWACFAVRIETQRL